ncbi:MAG: hypothetical protein ACI857_001066 [Arenicella sp.]|jgi:hypothetical protein
MKRILLPIIAILGFSPASQAQGMFDINFINDINIDFYDTNWDFRLDSLAALTAGTGSGTGRILADITINGCKFDSCGVRYKGNSSQDANSDKNPFNIDLNYIIAGQEFQGKDKIKLANCFTDPSMVREALTYEIANKYMNGPRGSFVRLAINTDYIGIYTNTESVDNEFLEEHYGSSKNPFFKCDPIAFDIFGDNSNLAYHPDTITYDTLYDMKSLYGLKALQDFTYELEFNSTNIDQFLDVDGVLWFLALSSALVHNDGYTAFGHNFYFYQMDNGKWSIILWDVNMSFGGLLWNGTNLFPLSETDIQNQDPYLHIGDPDFRPLIGRLLSMPIYKRMYTAHFKTIMEENINNGDYMVRAQMMSTLIDADRQNETFNEYTYQNFLDNLTASVGTGFGLRVGLEPLMTARETYIYTLPEFNANQPTISNESTNPVQPDLYTMITFNCDAVDADQVFLYYRHDKFDTFSYVEMFDDGANNDGAAGDGQYGVDITILGSDVQYYFYADNATAGKFSPLRAAYEFYTLIPRRDLVINEISTKNGSIAADLDGDYDDWVEIYNNSASAIDLAGYHLSDKSGNLLKWTFPAYDLQPDEYFIVWCDSQMTQSGVHANFKLNGSGEGVFLSNDLGFAIDDVDFPKQHFNITYGRLPNGDGPFDYLTPTFGTQNDALAGQEETIQEIESFKLYPNPAKEILNISLTGGNFEELRIYNLQGQEVLYKQTNSAQNIILDISNLEKGTYVIQISNMKSQKFVVL